MSFPTAIAAVGIETGIVAAVTGAVAIGASMVAIRARHAATSVQEQLDRLGQYDAVSDLPNRQGLRNWLEIDLAAAEGQTTDIGVMIVDLDRLKHVNDMFGREVGDKLIRAVADRIRSVLEPGDRLARFGGDEFVLVSNGITGTNGLSGYAARLIRLIEQPYAIGGQTLRITANVGAVLVTGPGPSADEIIRQADVARYQANARGSGQVVIFEPAMSSALSPTNAEGLVREALEKGAFRLVYQPVVDLSTGYVIGAEALLRWVSTDRGTLSPDEFIPVLEETGLIVKVGTWVLQEACAQAARLRTLLPDHSPPTITINVSARQLAQDSFAETVAAALRTTGASEHQIHLEITEGALMHDVSSAWAVLRQAKALGVKLALDDFGTGYSSLSYVRRFSLDMLKIDKSFIDGLDSSPEDRAIVEHVIGLAEALGMTTVAEGVERPEQLAWLRQLGCRMAQGYALSRPLAPEDLEALLLRRASEPFQFATTIGEPPTVGTGNPRLGTPKRSMSSGWSNPFPYPDPRTPGTSSPTRASDAGRPPKPGAERRPSSHQGDGSGGSDTSDSKPAAGPPMIFTDPAQPASPPPAPRVEPPEDLLTSPGTGASRVSLPRFREFRPTQPDQPDGS
ncbi:MAG: EAL domain-containing protein [Microthrixaceae bacterium]|jgi:diguanylate cyclase (GGDEF)-like protein|nr:EAL domain-containing protein [Microthrixaceae bacterium]